MRTLNYELKQLCFRNRDGSFATQADRLRMLQLTANQLHDSGFRDLRASGLKPKHIKALSARWQADGLNPGTIKNRMVQLRWWAQKIGKAGIMADDNKTYGIPDRQLVNGVDKARTLKQAELSRIIDPYTAVSLKLQGAFGLRRAESIKIQPSWADRGDRLFLKASWCKGGREREIPIRTTEQRQVLNEARRLSQGGSLIPRGLRFIDQLQRFKHQCSVAGIHRVHGHRHAYAQARYLEIAGWKAPAAGGPTSNVLTPTQRELDRDARLAVSRELGHERDQITAVYLGR